MEVRKTLTLNKPLSAKTLTKIKIKKTPEDIKKRIAEDKHKKKNRITDALQWLCERYPDCFNLIIRKPLKLKIENDIFKDHESMIDQPGVPSKKSLRDAISYYVHNIKYLKSSLKHTHRIDLQGHVLSDHPVTDEHIDYIKKMIGLIDSKKLKSKSKPKKTDFKNKKFPSKNKSKNSQSKSNKPK